MSIAAVEVLEAMEAIKAMAVRYHSRFCVRVGHETTCLHCVAKVYAVLPVFAIKCLCMFWRAGYEGGRKTNHTSISVFDFYDLKTL